jgi:hypothetical protein
MGIFIWGIAMWIPAGRMVSRPIQAAAREQEPASLKTCWQAFPGHPESYSGPIPGLREKQYRTD